MVAGFESDVAAGVSCGHRSGDKKKPHGHVEVSPVLTFEMTFRFAAACFRHMAPPNVGMA